MVFELDMKVLEFEKMGQNQNYVQGLKIWKNMFKPTHGKPFKKLKCSNLDKIFFLKWRIDQHWLIPKMRAKINVERLNINTHILVV
jgi:hypothetical protein